VPYGAAQALAQTASGSLAMLAAMRRVSSRVSSLMDPPGPPVAFGEQRTCAAEARGPYSARMTHLGHGRLNLL
jgi:hypothetical protein